MEAVAAAPPLLLLAPHRAPCLPLLTPDDENEEDEVSPWNKLLLAHGISLSCRTAPRSAQQEPPLLLPACRSHPRRLASLDTIIVDPDAPDAGSGC